MVSHHRFHMAVCWFFYFLFVQTGVSQFSVKATVSTDRISVDQPFWLVYRTENAPADHIKIPSVPGLTISKPTETISNFSITHGKLIGYEEIKYPVIARKPGKFIIPPAKVTIKGKIYQSNSVEITVLAGKKEKPVEAEGDVFFKAVLSDNPVYLGQQVLLHYDIYTNQDLINANFTRKPSFQHIFSKLLNTRHTGRNVVISQKQYYTQTIESFILYAQKTGVLPLEKAEIEYKYEIKNEQNPFYNDVITKTKKTNNLDLEVWPLPDEDVPASFSGGVGSFTFSAHVDKQTITMDDVVRVTMTIRGDGDPKYWKAPDWENVDGAEFYEPNLISENTEIDKGREFTTRVYEYLVQINKPMDFVLQPKFSFFDPWKKSYIELKDKPVIVKVLPGNTSSRANGKNDVQVTEDQPVMSDYSYKKFIVPAMLLGLISLLVLIFRKNISGKKIRLKPEKKDNASYIEKVYLHLQEVELHEQKGDHKAFFNDIMKAIYLFLKEKLNEGHELTDKKMTLTLLRDKNLQPNVVNELEKILFTCEMAVFAGQKPEMTGVRKTTKSLINSLEDIL